MREYGWGLVLHEQCFTLQVYLLIFDGGGESNKFSLCEPGRMDATIYPTREGVIRCLLYFDLLFSDTENCQKSAHTRNPG